MKLAPAQIRQYHDQGFLVVSGLFDAATVRRMVAHYMAMNDLEHPSKSVMGGDPANPADPLNKYPRPIQMHPWDKPSAEWASVPGVLAAVQQLIDDEPVLNQTMLYYKPPGARGQALHQDQQYITIDPLIGVWVALDDADRANGQMVVIPGSHKLGMMPVEAADISKSFTGGQTKLPAGARELGVDMKAGDVLFFHGKCIHGSHPNVTTDRFRRSFICHYVGKNAKTFTPEQGTHMTHVGAKKSP
ncbi:MAG: phytanoyl-CoA dioxygenase family protein [Planctomycetes bacterium]|nr:phytanoyl-CoA dioxygenase family protein [Planctomycetota bacterium]